MHDGAAMDWMEQERANITSAASCTWNFPTEQGQPKDSKPYHFNIIDTNTLIYRGKVLLDGLVFCFRSRGRPQSTNWFSDNYKYPVLVSLTRWTVKDLLLGMQVRDMLSNAVPIVFDEEDFKLLTW